MLTGLFFCSLSPHPCSGAETLAQSLCPPHPAKFIRAWAYLSFWALKGPSLDTVAEMTAKPTALLCLLCFSLEQPEDHLALAVGFLL